MKVLVHSNVPETEAYGIWWVEPETGLLKNLYRDDAGPQAARGRIIVYAKDNPDVSWSEYFDALTSRAPYVESWGVYDSAGFTPRQMLTSLESTPLP